MQRVAIGRALVREPAVTLMDEPLSSLDAKLRNDLRLELKRIQQDLGATLLYVTHDQIEAMTLATRIGVLERGALVQVGTPQQIYRDPVSSYVAARLGSPRINLLPRARDRQPARADRGSDDRRAARRLAPAPGQRPRQRPRACAGAARRASRRPDARATSRSPAPPPTPNWSRCAATPPAWSPAARCRSNSTRRCSSMPPGSASPD